VNDYYDRQGNPIPMLMWAALYEAGHRVALDVIGDVTISTVWLGLNHNFSGIGPPLIFETLVFAVDRRPLGDLEDHMWRWSTEVQALAGHDQAVSMVREHLTRNR